MGDTGSKTVLGRIAAAGREDHQARAMTLQKAMRITLPKIADAQMNLPLAVIGAVLQQVQGDALGDLLRDEALLIQLDGPGSARGAVLIDPAVVGGLIQQQTIGTVRPDTAAPRPMTRTDAAICAPFLDALFEQVPSIVDDPADARLVDGFRFGVKAADSRTLLMRLEALDYTVVRLTLDLSHGARQGELILFLPKPEMLSARGAPDEEGDGATSRQPEMSDVVMGLKTDLNMILCRLNVSFKSLRDLRPGDVLSIPAGQFPNVQITTNTGRVVGDGTVGHVDGVRAVKPKRVPLHATQPLRRASDRDQVDLPDVEEIGEIPGRDSPESRNVERRENQPPEDLNPDKADLPDLPDLEGLSQTMPSEDGGVDAPELAPLPALDPPKLEDLPDLDDLPDLSELPDLQAMAIAN